MTHAKHLGRIGGLLAALAVAPMASADSGRGRHRQLYAVPPPAAMVIDGKLDEWDLSGQIEMFVVEPTRDTMNAKFAVAYDGEALYLAAEVRDPSPMMNRNDPAANPGRGWNADSCQFRLVTNPQAAYPETASVWPFRAAQGENQPLEDTRDDILHLTLWYFTDAGQPCLTIQKGMTYRSLHPDWRQGLVPPDHYQAAYAQHPDGRGYTFEYRLPWALLGAARPLRGGDAVAGTVQFNWSTPEGFGTAGGSAWSYDVLGKPGFPFQAADCWGRIFFHENGNVAEELVLAGVPRARPLPLEFNYELPADGETTLQLVKADGTVVRILVPQQERLGGPNTERWNGLDDTGDILPAGTYRWQGIHFGQPLRPEYRFSVHNSGRPPYPTDDGKGAWGGDHGTPQDIVALHDRLLLVWSGAEYGSGTIRTDLEGRKQWGMQSGGTHLATDGKRYYTAGDQGFHRGEGVSLFDSDSGRPLALANGVNAFPPPPGGESGNNRPSGLAWQADTLYVSFRDRDLVALYSTTDGTLKGTLPVPAPGRLATMPAGDLLVISQGKVLRVQGSTATESNRQQPAAVESRELLTDHLDEPVGIAVGADGTIYVANRGARQNVAVFAADGTYRRSIGKAGGRPTRGLYDPTGMLEPGGLALDAKGRLWVAETLPAPKRISVWDTHTGELLKEFFGASGYMAYGTIDPARPHEIYAESVLWTIDWKSYQTRPLSTVWRKTAPNLAPPADSGPTRLLTTADGRQHMWGHHRIGNTIHSVMLRRDGDLFKPFMAIFNTRGSEPTGVALLDHDHETYPRRHPRLQPHYFPVYFWQDANDDQTVQPDELTALPGGDFPNYPPLNFSWVEPDLTVRFNTQHLWQPVGFDAHGAPIYDPAQAKPAPAFGPNRYATGLGDGSLITLRWVNVQRGDRGPSLVRWSPTGQMLWNYPNLIGWQAAMNLPMVQAGRLWSMTGTMGQAGDFFAHQTYFGPQQLFRTDGMYVGALLKDGRTGGRGAYEGMPEGQFGSFVKLEIDGQQRYFTIGAGGDVRVWEVHGLDAIRDLLGDTYVHTDEQVAKARAALAAYQASLDGPRQLRIVAGGLAALDTATATSREIEGGRGFSTRLAYDAENLYVRFAVTSPHGLANAIADPRIICRGGNLLDLQLATDPNADPKRQTPTPGDLRLLVTRQDNKPFAMLYQPKVAGFAGEPIVLTSPTGKEAFDRIAALDHVGLEEQKTDTGFLATLTLPQSMLGLKLAPGQTIKLDLGYVFGNREGTRTAVRAYLFNRSFAANVVDDIPHESRLEPAHWGTAVVE